LSRRVGSQVAVAAAALCRKRILRRPHHPHLVFSAARAALIDTLPYPRRTPIVAVVARDNLHPPISRLAPNLGPPAPHLMITLLA
jgi:hypothetical protein